MIKSKQIDSRFSVKTSFWLNSILFSMGMLFTCHAYAAQAVTFYHNDMLGSPVAVTDINGDLCWREDYKPYGEKIQNNDGQQPSNPLCGLGDNQRGYTNHVHDKDIGLTYMQARYYDPAIGRFMGIDPIGVRLDNQVSFNRYAYGNNNPYKYVDPDGEWGTHTFNMIDNLAQAEARRKEVEHARAIAEEKAIKEGIKTGLTGANKTASAVSTLADAAVVFSGGTSTPVSATVRTISTTVEIATDLALQQFEDVAIDASKTVFDRVLDSVLDKKLKAGRVFGKELREAQKAATNLGLDAVGAVKDATDSDAGEGEEGK